MNDKHPITPSPELVREWLGTYFCITLTGEVSTVQLALATQAARWGADQGVEEACRWLVLNGHCQAASWLRVAMRPKPPSLKEQALEALESAPSPSFSNLMRMLTHDQHDLIYRALEALPND